MILGMSGDCGASSAFIAALDVGTTTVRCQIINSSAVAIGTARQSITLHYPKPGWVEIDPDELLNNILKVIKDAVNDANISFANLNSLGISTQRATFITWEKDSGKYLHNFITWKDLRAVELLHSLNSSWSSLMLRWSAYFLYLCTGNKKFGMASKLKFASNHVSGRFLWVLSHVKEVKEALQNDNLMFGTLETWLVYKLTGGATYVTDISNASATGFYDPFDLNWGIMAKVLRIPIHILPQVVDNDYDFGTVKENFFGSTIKIGSVMADQSSSMFGSCCFYENDVKVTMGTGAFLDVNTYVTIHPSLNGMYPLVGWKMRKEIIYLSEVSCSDAGSVIEWLMETGFIQNPSQTSDMANSVKDSDGIYFIPAFSGIGPPFNYENAGTGLIGIKPTTTKEHIVRAVLESIVYRIILTYGILKKERSANYSAIRVDGGVSKNDFICQMLANLANIRVERMFSSEMSVMGVAYVAGLSCGFWKSKEDISSLSHTGRVFEPTNNQKDIEKSQLSLSEWTRAVERFKCWYKDD